MTCDKHYCNGSPIESTTYLLSYKDCYRLQTITLSDVIYMRFRFTPRVKTDLKEEDGRDQTWPDRSPLSRLLGVNCVTAMTAVYYKLFTFKYILFYSLLFISKTIL